MTDLGESSTSSASPTGAEASLNDLTEAESVISAPSSSTGATLAVVVVVVAVGVGAGTGAGAGAATGAGLIDDVSLAFPFSTVSLSTPSEITLLVPLLIKNAAIPTTPRKTEHPTTMPAIAPPPIVTGSFVGAAVGAGTTMVMAEPTSLLDEGVTDALVTDALEMPFSAATWSMIAARHEEVHPEAVLSTTTFTAAAYTSVELSPLETARTTS